MSLHRPLIAMALIAALAATVSAQKPVAPMPPTDADFYGKLVEMGLADVVALAATEPVIDADEAVVRRDALVGGYLAQLRNDHARWKRGLALA